MKHLFRSVLTLAMTFATNPAFAQTTNMGTTGMGSTGMGSMPTSMPSNGQSMPMNSGSTFGTLPNGSPAGINGQNSGGNYNQGSYNSNGSNSGGSSYNSSGSSSYSRNSGYSDSPARPVFANCPFQADDKDVLSTWDASKMILRSIKTTQAGCQQALDAMVQGMDAGSSSIGQNLQDPTFASRARMREIDARLFVLNGQVNNCASTSSTATASTTGSVIGTDLTDSSLLSGSVSGVFTTTVTSACSEKDALIAEEYGLRTQIDNAENQRDANITNTARTQTFQSVKGTLDAIPNVRNACSDAGPNVLNTIGRAGFSLLSSSVPLLMGANAGISALSSVLSSFVGAFRSRSSSEKGLAYMQNREDLENITCLYFQTMRLQCGIAAGPKHLQPADAQRLEDMRSLFEAPKANPFGERLRGLFDTLYGDRKKPLGPSQAAMIPQFCAIMTNIPGKSDRCPASQPGPTFSDCRYLNYYQHGTNIQAPADRQSFPKDAPPGILNRGVK